MSNTSSKEQDKSNEELEEYWTEERRSNAQAKPMPVVPEEKTGEGGEDQEQGNPVITPPNTSILSIRRLDPSNVSGRVVLKGMMTASGQRIFSTIRAIPSMGNPGVGHVPQSSPHGKVEILIMTTP